MVTHHCWVECVPSVAAACGVPSTRCVTPWLDSVTVRPGSKVGHVTSVRISMCCRGSSVCVSNDTQTHTCLCVHMISVCYHVGFSLQHVMTSALASYSMTWTCYTTTSCLSISVPLPWHRTNSCWHWRTGHETCRYKPWTLCHQGLPALNASRYPCKRFLKFTCCVCPGVFSEQLSHVAPVTTGRQVKLFDLRHWHCKAAGRFTLIKTRYTNFCFSSSAVFLMTNQWPALNNWFNNMLFQDFKPFYRSTVQETQ